RVLASAAAHRALHPFPTRRSSDLWAARPAARPSEPEAGRSGELNGSCRDCKVTLRAMTSQVAALSEQPVVTLELHGVRLTLLGRSEEHTSELQSRENLVCRLLLEK